MDDQVEGNLLFTPENKQLLCGLFRPLLLENYNPEACAFFTSSDQLSWHFEYAFLDRGAISRLVSGLLQLAFGHINWRLNI